MLCLDAAQMCACCNDCFVQVNEIFSYLGVVDVAQLSAVCTRWFYLLQDKSLWESVRLLLQAAQETRV